MRFLRMKSEPDRLLDTVGESLAALSGGVNTVGDSLAALSGGVNKSKLLKAGAIAGGVAALTAGSAAISSIRRRVEGNDS